MQAPGVWTPWGVYTRTLQKHVYMEMEVEMDTSGDSRPGPGTGTTAVPPYSGSGSGSVVNLCCLRWLGPKRLMASPKRLAWWPGADARSFRHATVDTAVDNQQLSHAVRTQYSDSLFAQSLNYLKERRFLFWYQYVWNVVSDVPCYSPLHALWRCVLRLQYSMYSC